MFLDESAFDDGGEDSLANSKYKRADSRPSTASNTRHSNKDDDEDDDLPFRSAGGLGTPSSSRARMLAQQRELQLKKRQSSMLSGGMVRSSVDSNVGSNSPMRSSTDSQFTPAIRQFSAPKAVRESNMDTGSGISPRSSEFGPGSGVSRRNTAGAPTSRSSNRQNRYSDDDEEIENQRRNQQRRQPQQQPPRGSRRRFDDEEEEDEPEDWAPKPSRQQQQPSSRGNGSGRPSTATRRSKYDDDDDEEEDDYRWNGKGSRGNNRNSRDQEEEDYRRGGERGKWKSGGDTPSAGGSRRGQQEDLSPPRSQKTRSQRDGLESPAAAVQRGNTLGGREERQMSPTSSAPNSPAPPVATPPDLSNLRQFLVNPVPKECGVIQCYIRRNKGGTNKLFPIYSLFLKEGDVFLLASKKRPKNKTSNYHISMDPNELNKTGDNYLGKLRSNFVGTEFQVFDNGVNPKDTEPDEMSRDGAVRCELGAVMYAANVLGSRGPRKMQVALPGLDENGRITKFKDGTGGDPGSNEDILSRMKDRNLRNLVYLINKPPRWNEQVGAYVLNFNGRVTMASVKNFQLVDPDEQNAVVLQFGRVGKDEFTMDLQWPISPLQAFGVTLSSFDSKIACD